MTTPTPSMQGIPLSNDWIHDMERLVFLQQEPVTALKLTAYAADAMRVLMMLERHASISKPFDDMLMTACHDWRNPGSINEPADLIAVVLAQSIAVLQSTHREMEQLISTWPAKPPSRA